MASRHVLLHWGTNLQQFGTKFRRKTHEGWSKWAVYNITVIRNVLYLRMSLSFAKGKEMKFSMCGTYITNEIGNERMHTFGKNTGKWQFLWSERRWDDNINTDLKEIGCENGLWVGQGFDQWRVFVLSALKVSPEFNTELHNVYFSLVFFLAPVIQRSLKSGVYF
jgi:hypothetical protein